LTEFDKVLARAGEALLEEERQMLGEVIAHLPDRERRFLGALSLFHGSFSLALVETTTLFAQCSQLCCCLREKHLLQQEEQELAQDTPRFQLTGAVRELARSLLTPEEHARYQRRIACWFAAKLYRLSSLPPASSLHSLYQPLFAENDTLTATLQAHLESGQKQDLQRAVWLVFVGHAYWELLGRPHERFEWLWKLFERQDEISAAFLPRLWKHLLDSMGGCVDTAHWLPQVLERLPELEARVDPRSVGLFLMRAGYSAHHAERDAQALTLFATGLERLGGMKKQTPQERAQLASLLCAYTEAL
jgi:hypothetical protein